MFKWKFTIYFTSIQFRSLQLLPSKHLTNRSLAFHLKSCRKQFEAREAKKPPGERRVLLEQEDLPEGAGTLIQYYDIIENETPKPKPSVSQSQTTSPKEKRYESFEESLRPCPYCLRTFDPDRLHVHMKACLHRPKKEDAPVKPVKRNSVGASVPALIRIAVGYGGFFWFLFSCSGFWMRITLQSSMRGSHTVIFSEREWQPKQNKKHQNKPQTNRKESQWNLLWIAISI